MFLSQPGGVWLIHFWDYTDAACMGTLPYLAEWHRRYACQGLTIVGVHTPRFRFARQRHLVERASTEFGIEYPVLLDNYHRLRHAYGSDLWPAQYLVDGRRWIRYAHLGVGRYDEVETAIHVLLRQSDPSLELPPVMRPLESHDEPGTSLRSVTPDLYAGYERGRFGDLDGYVYDHTVIYEDPGDREEGVLYAHGQWHTSSNYLAFMGEQGNLAFTYRATGVSAVLSPTWDEIALMLQLREGLIPRVTVWLDDASIAPTDAGRDIVYDSGCRSIVMVDRPRLFGLTRHPGLAEHELRLTFSDRDVAVYQFSFLSARM
jgi:hypothetical protein